MTLRSTWTTGLTVALLASPMCATPPQTTDPRMSGPLVSARTTMVTAWIVPRNPLIDRALDRSRLSEQVRLGYRIFTNTPVEASRLTPSKVSCSNCHLNAGQREKSLPLVNIAGVFPEYNRRAGRLINLPDRIIECFMRSENSGRRDGHNDQPSATSSEVLAISAFIVWLSRGAEVGASPSWRGQNTIPANRLIPIGRLDPAEGARLFTERCQSCHGADGQGVAVGDKKPGPLWGSESWNDGAGFSRVYTLAGFIRYAMPYLDPGSLTDNESQQLAAFITSKPRSIYAFKDDDYLTEPIPADAVYYARGKQ